jgi:hypothetical protein
MTQFATNGSFTKFCYKGHVQTFMIQDDEQGHVHQIRPERASDSKEEIYSSSSSSSEAAVAIWA